MRHFAAAIMDMSAKHAVAMADMQATMRDMMAQFTLAHSGSGGTATGGVSDATPANGEAANGSGSSNSSGSSGD